MDIAGEEDLKIPLIDNDSNVNQSDARLSGIKPSSNSKWNFKKLKSGFSQNQAGGNTLSVIEPGLNSTWNSIKMKKEFLQTQTVRNPLKVKSESSSDRDSEDCYLPLKNLTRTEFQEDIMSLHEQAEAMRILLEYENKKFYTSRLNINQIGFLLDEIMSLERLQVQRLNPNQIISLMLSFFQESNNLDAESTYNLIQNLILNITPETRAKILPIAAIKEPPVKAINLMPCRPSILQKQPEELLSIELVHFAESSYYLCESSINSIFMSANGRFVAVALQDKSILLLNTLEMSEEFSLTGHEGAVYTVCISPGIESIISGSEDCTVKMWSIDQEEELHTFVGHIAPVRSIAVSVDGEFIYSGSDDHLIKIWSVQAHNEECTLVGHSDSVRSLAISADGTFLASASADKTVKIWKTSERVLLHTFEGHTSAVNAVAIGTDGELVFSGADDWSIKVWRVQGGIEEYSFLGHKGAVTCLAVSRDGKMLASGSVDNNIKVWSTIERKEMFMLTCNDNAIKAVAVSPDLSNIVSGSDNNTLRMHNLRIKKSVCELQADGTGRIKGIAVNKDCTFLVTASEDKTVKMWNIEERREICTFIGHIAEVNAVVLSPDENFVVSASVDKSIKIWRIDDRKEEFSFEGHTDSVEGVVITPDGNFIVSCSRDKTIRIWSISERIQEFIAERHSGIYWNLAITSDGQYVVSGSSELVLWNFHKLTEEHVFKGHKREITSVDISFDKQYLASASEDIVKIWKLKQRHEKCTLTGHTVNITAIKFTQCSQFLVSGDNGGDIIVWDVQKESELFRIYSYCICALEVSADGRFLFSGSLWASIRIWDISSEKLPYSIIELTKFIQNATISPDGRFILIIAHSLIIWNIKEWREEFKIPEDAYIWEAEFTPDGRFIVGALANRTVKIWNFHTRKEECSLIGHTDVVFSVAVSSDSKLIISASSDKTVRIWDIQERSEKIKLTGLNCVVSVAVSPDNKLVASGSTDITIWNIKKQKEEFVLVGHEDTVYKMAFTQDQKFIISASIDRTVKLWNIQEARVEHTFGGKTNEIRALAIINENLVAFESEDHKLAIWNISERRVECELIGHTKKINSVSISPNLDFLVSSSSDMTVRIWKLKQENNREIICEDDQSLTSVGISPDEKFLATVSCQRNIIIWNIHGKKFEFALSGHTSEISSIKFSDDGEFIISKSRDNIIKIWNFLAKKEETITEDLCEKLLKCITATNDNFRYYPEYLYLCSVGDILLVSNTIVLEILRINPVSNTIRFLSFDSTLYINTFDYFSLSYAIEMENYEYLSQGAWHLSTSKLGFTIMHVLCYQGQAEAMRIAGRNFQLSLKTDIFGKSPFYYAISVKRKDCVDILLQHLESLREANLNKYQESLYALRNDFKILIANSPSQLHVLLQNLITSSTEMYATVTEQLPIIKLGNTRATLLEDFTTDENSEEILITLQSSMFPFIGSIGTFHNIKLLNTIICCSNIPIIKSPIISYFVRFQFDQVSKWIILYTLLLTANLVLLMLIVGLKSFNLYFVGPFLSINIFLMIWETIQFLTNKKHYLKNQWNYLDVARTLGTLIWITIELYGFSYLSFRWIVACMNLIRGITFFLLFDGTRFYIRLIVRALNDIKYFFVMFAYSTFTAGMLLMISREEDLTFEAIWGESYHLNFGNYESANTGSYTLEYIVYFAATAVNVILMLNLLISILGDSHERFQMEQPVVNIKEKAEIALELQSMMFWKPRTSELMYLNICNTAFIDQDKEEWDGRVKYIDKKLDKIIKEIGDNRAKPLISRNCKDKMTSKIIIDKIESAEVSIKESNELVLKKITNSSEKGESIVRNKVESLENEIGIVRNKVESFENRFNLIESKLGSIQGENHDLSEKLEMILNILSK